MCVNYSSIKLEGKTPSRDPASHPRPGPGPLSPHRQASGQCSSHAFSDFTFGLLPEPLKSGVTNALKAKCATAPGEAVRPAAARWKAVLFSPAAFSV